MVPKAESQNAALAFCANRFVLPPDNEKRLVRNQPREGLLSNGAGKAESQNAALAFCANRFVLPPDNKKRLVKNQPHEGI
ncbi:hypothetical protein [Cloacibacillus evryensis]|uniref:hypothetical protein n=1 Tax=Cloacibacillus evryensis TaxID=508460 RepID=UPI002B204BB6|nr:hypothetical protein [Cloacibacillus evryensis]MEA5035606.1 hypothetical protein [Cloacibacillus evryensis]